MTPLHILIGIHYHTRPCPYAEWEPVHGCSPAVIEYTQHLVDAGLLRPREPTFENTAAFESTEGLRMWVEALESVPLPKRAWVHPMCDTRVLVDG